MVTSMGFFCIRIRYIDTLNTLTTTGVGLCNPQNFGSLYSVA